MWHGLVSVTIVCEECVQQDNSLGNVTRVGQFSRPYMYVCSSSFWWIVVCQYFQTPVVSLWCVAALFVTCISTAVTRHVILLSLCRGCCSDIVKCKYRLISGKVITAVLTTKTVWFLLNACRHGWGWPWFRCFNLYSVSFCFVLSALCYQSKGGLFMFY